MELIIRADASRVMGSGHVMRCLALAEAARQRGFPVRLAGRISLPWLRERIAGLDLDFHLLDGSIPERELPAELLPLIGPAKAGSVLVLDGYHFGPDCQRAAREAGVRLLVIDDYNHLPEYACDLLLNQNIGAEGLRYAGDIGRGLLGPGYALLRKEFAAHREKALTRHAHKPVESILLSLGGGDFSSYLARLDQALTIPEMAGRILTVVRGAMPQAAVSAALAGCPAELRLLDRVDDMPGLMLGADLCLSAGGSTCWELCCLGVPFLTVAVARNQDRIVAGLAARGIAPLLSAPALARALTDPVWRMERMHRGMSMVDGRGAQRVLEQLRGPA